MATTKTRLQYHFRQLKKAGKLTGTISGCVEKAMARQESRVEVRSKPTYCHLQFSLPELTTLIPLGDIDEERADSRAMEDFPRRKRWIGAEAGYRNFVAEVNEGRYSRSCTFAKINYMPTMRSCGRVTQKHLVAFVGERHIRFAAPRGCEFGRDRNGLYLVHSKNAHREEYRYHFDSDEVRHGRTALHKALLAHVRGRKELAKEKRLASQHEAAVRQNEAAVRKLGVWVRFRDSIAAGNCPAGTRSWCQQRQLNPRRAYPLKVVEKLAEKNSLAARACRVAVERAVEDYARGYCELS
jgi:hypothetical protein